MLTSPQDHWMRKQKEFESWSEKTRKIILDQSETEKLKKVVLKQRNFTRRWWQCVSVGGRHFGRLEGGRLGEVSQLGRLGGLGR